MYMTEHDVYCGSSEICGSSVEKLIVFCISMFNYLNNEVQKKEFPPICTSHSNAAHNEPTKTPYCTTHFEAYVQYIHAQLLNTLSGVRHKYRATASSHSMALPYSNLRRFTYRQY